MRDELHMIETTENDKLTDITDPSGVTVIHDMGEWSEEYTTRHARVAAIPYHKRQIAKAMAALLVFLALATATVLFTTQTGYAIYMNGEELGSAKDMVEIEQAVESVETQVSEILGYDYSIKDEIEVGATRTALSSSRTPLEDAILENVNEISLLYALKIDGEVVAACSDPSAFDAMLSEILDGYSNENTTSVSFAETVAIAREYIKSDVLQDMDEIRTLLDPANAASAIRLTVTSSERVRRTIEVGYDVEYIYDDTVYEGTDAILQQGAFGVSDITEQVTYVNGVERSRLLLDERVVSEPVNSIISIGTKYRPYYVSYGEYCWPATGIITSEFGPRSGYGSSDHQGIDIAGRSGQDIYAADGGEVIYADWQGGYGNLVMIEHDNGDVTYYAHCTSLAVAVGDLVGRGDLIAYMGTTGASTGNHLHFEIRTGGEAVDPLEYLPQEQE